MNAMSPSSPGSSYTPPPPPAGGASAGGDRQLMLVLSYLGILGLIPLIMRGQDKEIRWHAINGLALFGAYVVIAILWAVLNNFMPPGLGCALSFAGCGIFIAYLAVAIFGLMKALKGQRLRIPILSDIADK